VWKVRMYWRFERLSAVAVIYRLEPCVAVRRRSFRGRWHGSATTNTKHLGQSEIPDVFFRAGDTCGAAGRPARQTIDNELEKIPLVQKTPVRSDQRQSLTISNTLDSSSTTSACSFSLQSQSHPNCALS